MAKPTEKGRRGALSPSSKPPDGNQRTNLVDSATTFFGRSDDLAAVRRLFEQGSLVVTLVGPGGMGKTRAARAYGTHHHAEYSALWFCDLTYSQSLGDVCAAVARAMGIQGSEVTEAAWMERIGREIDAVDRTLVILDNCEQVLAPVQNALPRWRDLAPNAHWLLTSRQPLRIAGERPHELGPLPLPVERGNARASEAVQLFVDRARTARPGYVLDAGNVDAIVALVRALDGLPLAIELAAARMGVLGADALLRRLSGSFAALGQGPHDTPVRHQTLEATIAWSWDLLTSWEKAALRQCTVFRGGFTVEAAEAVVDLAGFEGAPSVIDVLQQLRDKSLLRSLPRSDGELRLGFYETIREFAARQLASSGEERVAREGHARFFLAPAERWSRRADASLPRVELWGTPDDDLENLLAVHGQALARATTDSDAARDALSAMVGLEPILARRESSTERLELLDRTLAAAEGATDARAYGWLLLEASMLRHRQGQSDRYGDFDRVLTLARSTGDAPLEAYTEVNVGERCLHRNDLDRALAHFEHALAVSGVRRLAHIEAHARIGIGCVQLGLGRTEDARRGLLEALQCARKLEGEYRSRTAGACLINLAELMQLVGDFDAAERHLAEAAIELALHPYECSYIRGAQARLTHERGQPAAARAMYVEALDGLQQTSSFFGSLFLGALGAAQADCDEGAEANRTLDEAETLATTKRETSALATLAIHRGHVDLARARACEARGDHEAAARHRSDARQRLRAPVSAPSTEIWFARRLLERALAPAGTSQSTEAARGPLVVSRDGRVCCMPDKRVVDLSRRSALRRLLLALVESRLQTPGRTRDVQKLFAAGWPGERAGFESARARVYVAINTLRELGLRNLLLRQPEGYMLDPAVEVVHER